MQKSHFQLFVLFLRPSKSIQYFPFLVELEDRLLGTGDGCRSSLVVKPSTFMAVSRYIKTQCQREGTMQGKEEAIQSRKRKKSEEK